ncbi:fructose-1,6-bisphosphatase [Alphaproteobacteria bacterium]|nr:fructose-1,6-bisphosphatase [Alphaproteobacteria bacterium]
MLSKLNSQIIEVVEKTAIACYPWIGKGDNHQADQVAVDAMRSALNNMAISGTIVIGEGERDEAPMLYIGEKVGTSGVKIDIALDPLEGTTICANASESSLAVIAFGEDQSFLHAPDVYMEKIAVGANLPDGVVDLDNSVANNLKNLAKAKKIAVSDLMVMILDRPRHQEMIAKVREIGAKIRLIGDGDVAGVIACTNQKTRVDIYMGTGGAPEGVLASCALKVIGGQMQGRLIFNDDQKQIQRAKKMGITDLSKKYREYDMAKGEVVFACAGVTDGYLLNGVKKHSNKYVVESLVLDSSSKKIIKTISEILL